MATGDVKNNLSKLLREVQRMRLQVEPDVQGLLLGSPSAFLPILHAALVHYSLPLADWLSQHGYDLYTKNDLRFLEGVYKVLRNVFHLSPSLSKEQFFSTSFAERKLILLADVLRCCQQTHTKLAGERGCRRLHSSQPGLRRAAKLGGSQHRKSGASATPLLEGAPTNSPLDSGNTWQGHLEVKAVQEDTPLPPPLTTSWQPPVHMHPHLLASSSTTVTPAHRLTPTLHKPHPPQPHCIPTPSDLVKLQTAVDDISHRLQLLTAPDHTHKTTPTVVADGHTHVTTPTLGLVVRHPIPLARSPVSTGQSSLCESETETAGRRRRRREEDFGALEPETLESMSLGAHRQSDGEEQSCDPQDWHGLQPVTPDPQEAPEVASGEGEGGGGGSISPEPSGPSLQEVSDQISGLMKMVQQMSARMVILETRLKLAEGKRTFDAPRPSTNGSSAPPPPFSPVESNLSTPANHCLWQPLTPAPPPTRRADSALHNSKPLISRWRGAQAAPRGRQCGSTSLTPPAQPLLGHTPSTIATPEDTKQLIRSLRNRARNTKELLLSASRASSSCNCSTL